MLGGNATEKSKSRGAAAGASLDDTSFSFRATYADTTDEKSVEEEDDEEEDDIAQQAAAALMTSSSTTHKELP